MQLQDDSGPQRRYEGLFDITGLRGGPLALNHTGFADNLIVFGDMHRLMATGRASA